MFDRMPKIVLVTWPRPYAHFQGNYLCACSAFPIQNCVPNLKSVAQVVLKFDRMPKTVGVTSLTWPRPRPFSEKIICAPTQHSRYKAAYQIWRMQLK